MTQPDLSLPEVPSFGQAARFFREGERDLVEIAFVGARDTIVQKVTPDIMARFKPEWDSYVDGTPMARRVGTSFAAVGVAPPRDENYILRNIHNAEELAALNDGQCMALGHGTLTDRERARKLLSGLSAQRKQEAFDAISKAAGKLASAPEAAPAPSADMTEIKDGISALNNNVAALVNLLTQQAAEKPKRGRPAKAKE